MKLHAALLTTIIASSFGLAASSDEGALRGLKKLFKKEEGNDVSLDLIFDGRPEGDVTLADENEWGKTLFSECLSGFVTAHEYYLTATTDLDAVEEDGTRHLAGGSSTSAGCRRCGGGCPYRGCDRRDLKAGDVLKQVNDCMEDFCSGTENGMCALKAIDVILS